MGPIVEATPRAVLLVSFPHQLLHALSALKYYRSRQGIPEDAPATILIWAFQSSQHEPNSAFRKILDCALSDFQFVTLVFPTLWERRYHLSPFRTLIERIGWIKSRLPSQDVGAVFFAHDASADQTAQALMQSFPKAPPVCFGDPPGFLYPQFHLQRQKSWLKRLVWRSRARGLLSLRSPELSIVTIDFYGNGGDDNSNVLTIPRDLVINTLACLQKGMECIGKGLRVDCTNQVGDAEAFYILLLSNFSESRLTNRRNELALYTDICQRAVPPGARLAIKPHFGTSPRFLKKLTTCLSPYNPEVFPPLIGQIPIEFFPELVGHANIISVSSSSALLSYLFQKRITHALTAERIRRYFSSGQVAYMLEANRAIENSLRADVVRNHGVL